MKVRLKNVMAGPMGAFKAGDVVDLPKEMALILLNSVPPQAERVFQGEKAVKVEKPEKEEAVDVAAEVREKAVGEGQRKGGRPKKGE
jgi:hypothetical protein